MAKPVVWRRQLLLLCGREDVVGVACSFCDSKVKIVNGDVKCVLNEKIFKKEN